MQRIKPKTPRTYYPHLDGLRCLAVCVILFYHTKLFTFTGGFLGVDVFFVISGFIITKIIISDLSLNQFSFINFYSRRLRRLMPALIFTFIVTSLYIWRYLPPNELVDYAKSALFSLGFLSNFWFYSTTDYHSVETTRLALVHTWSLGVEEQFYIIYPALLFLLFRHIKSSQIPAFLTAVAVISFLYSNILSHNNPQLSFYMITTRAWELLFGAILVFLPLKNICPRKSDIIIIFCLMLLITSFLYFDEKTLHPSSLTLLPVLSAGGLIYFGFTSNISKILFENRASVFIGKISYCLYLIHYPLMVFYYLKHPSKTISNYESVKIILLSLLLSVTCYFLVEKKLRSSSPKVFISFLSVSSISIVVILFVYLITNGLDYREKSINQLFYGTSREDIKLTKDGKVCFINRSGKGCRFSEPNSKGKLINIGDSHGYTFSNQAKVLAKKIKYDFEAINMTHCPYVPNAWRVTGFKAKCTVGMQEQAKNYFLSIEPALFIINVRWPMYLNYEQFDNGEGGVDRGLYLPFYPSGNLTNKETTVEDLIVRGITELAEYGHEIILVYPVPEVGWHVPDLIRSKLINNSPKIQKEIYNTLSITTSYKVYRKRIEKSKNVLDRIKHKNVLKIYPEDVFCNKESQRCYTHDQGSIYYRDDNHLSQTGTKMLRKHIESKLSKLIN